MEHLSLQVRVGCHTECEAFHSPILDEGTYDGQAPLDSIKYPETFSIVTCDCYDMASELGYHRR